jgi:glycosyltransferase involved in cell wall biosynthesis
MQRLSVVLTTLNEEENIDRCLGSVRWADEIVVVDSFSNDRTLERVRCYTDKVYQHEYEGSSRQVEWGISRATGDWVFVIDADETVSKELAEEIRAVIRGSNNAAGYEVPRRPFAFGRWIEHGGWFPDYQFRLFRRDGYQADHREVHGGFRTAGPTGRLNGFLLHHTYTTIASYVGKMNDYTSLDVSNKLRNDPRARSGWQNLILNPLSHFLRMFVSRKGYKDGVHGFVLAALDALYSLALYAKLWEYRMREAEGAGLLPPITNLELNKLKRCR